MRREFIPEALAEENANCPSCMARMAMDDSFTEFDRRLTAYAEALWNIRSMTSEMSAALTVVFNTLNQLRSIFSSLVEAFRCERAVLLVLYYAGDQYGLGNRLRKGVSAHDSYWEQAQQLMTELADKSAQLQAAHSALTDAVGLQQLDDATTSFIQQRCAPLAEQYPLVQERISVFMQVLAPWLEGRRQATFDILGLIENS